MDPLIKLAVLERNVTDISGNCEGICDTLYKFAGKDGHTIMNDSSHSCTCKIPQQENNNK